MNKMPNWFATTSPGFEPVVQRELAQAEIQCQPEVGGVRFEGSIATGLSLCTSLRTPSRLLLELGRGQIKGIGDVGTLLNLPDWSFLPKGIPFQLHISVQGSVLRKDIIQEKAKRVLKAILKGAPLVQDPQHIFLRLKKDMATLSIDAGGELLHRRGWRQEQGKASLRENWAASLLIMSGWEAEEPLLDPFCGSGTIPIEAALIAAGRSPFTRNAFAFKTWNTSITPPPLSSLIPNTTIMGSDHHTASLAMAKNNAERAGVSIDWTECDVSKITTTHPSGLIICNPPYGKRLGNNVLNTYKQAGKRLRNQFQGWRLLFLSPHQSLAKTLDQRAERLTTFINGGHRVGAWVLEEI